MNPLGRMVRCGAVGRPSMRVWCDVTWLDNHPRLMDHVRRYAGDCSCARMAPYERRSVHVMMRRGRRSVHV